MANPNYPQPRIVVEQSPWQTLFESLPNTMLSFMQLSHQIEQDRIDKEYKAVREDLAFERQQYSLTKERENKWIDTLSTMGFSTEHITGAGTESILSVSDDISKLTSATEQNISKLRAFSAELDTWKEKGQEWEQLFAAGDKTGREASFKDFVLEGGLTLDKEGNVVGTGEFADVLKSLSAVEISQLKDATKRKAVMKGLRDEATAIKMFSEAAKGEVAVAKIGEQRYVSDITNAINTAETYSGIAAIRRFESDEAKYKDATPEKLAQIETNKYIIGRDYQYLITGIGGLPDPLSDETDDSYRNSYLRTYNQMSLELSAAKPKYATGGYGSTLGTQKNYNDALANVYLNYQQKIQSDPEEASIFAAKTLQYFGVDITDPSMLEGLGITDHIETTKATRETLSSLSNIEDQTIIPLMDDPLANENLISSGGIPSDLDESLNAVTMSGKELFPGLLEPKYRGMDYELAYNVEELGGIDQTAHLEHQRKSLIGATVSSKSGYEYNIEDVRLKDAGKYVAGDSPFQIKIGGVWTETPALPSSLNDYTVVSLPFAPEGMPGAFYAGPIGYYWDPIEEEYRVKKSLKGL